MTSRPCNGLLHRGETRPACEFDCDGDVCRKCAERAAERDALIKRGPDGVAKVKNPASPFRQRQQPVRQKPVTAAIDEDPSDTELDLVECARCGEEKPADAFDMIRPGHRKKLCRDCCRKTDEMIARMSGNQPSNVTKPDPAAAPIAEKPEKLQPPAANSVPPVQPKEKEAMKKCAMCCIEKPEDQFKKKDNGDLTKCCMQCLDKVRKAQKVKMANQAAGPTAAGKPVAKTPVKTPAAKPSQPPVAEAASEDAGRVRHLAEHTARCARIALAVAFSPRITSSSGACSRRW